MWHVQWLLSFHVRHWDSDKWLRISSCCTQWTQNLIMSFSTQPYLLLTVSAFHLQSTLWSCYHLMLLTMLSAQQSDSNGWLSRLAKFALCSIYEHIWSCAFDLLQVNARRINDEPDVFTGVLSNKLFSSILLSEIILQVSLWSCRVISCHTDAK